MAKDTKIPRSQRQKANKKLAKEERKSSVPMYLVYGIGLFAISYSYIMLERHWDTSNFILTVFVTIAWLILFIKFVKKQRKK